MARIIAQNHNQVEMHLTPNDGPVCQAPDHAQVKIKPGYLLPRLIMLPIGRLPGVPVRTIARSLPIEAADQADSHAPQVRDGRFPARLSRPPAAVHRAVGRFCSFPRPPLDG